MTMNGRLSSCPMSSGRYSSKATWFSFVNSMKKRAVKISVVRYEDNWYRVTFTNDEATESRQIEAFPQNGKVIINDYR